MVRLSFYSKFLFNTLFGIAFICLLTLSCTPQINPAVHHGGEYYYRPGYPQVRFSALYFLNEGNQTGIKVITDIAYDSLIYTEKRDHLQAAIAVAIKIVSRKENNSFGKSNYYKIVLIKKDIGKQTGIVHF